MLSLPALCFKIDIYKHKAGKGGARASACQRDSPEWDSVCGFAWSTVTQLLLDGYHGIVLEDPSGPDRDTWCTPKWLAEAVGAWDVDPCSNGRSHIKASTTVSLELGGDGLALEVRPDTRVWINPPYSRGQVVRWVRAYLHTRFCFLLRFDSSTEWFALLIAHTAVYALPTQRVNFEPPPSVASSSNPFPHALFYADERDVTDEVKRLCLVLKPTRNRKRKP